MSTTTILQQLQSQLGSKILTLVYSSDAAMEQEDVHHLYNVLNDDDVVHTERLDLFLRSFGGRVGKPHIG